jgi:shikimate dehydrogenase
MASPARLRYVAPKPMQKIYNLADLGKWAAVSKNIEPPIRLGVLGDPVEHSFSPQMQNAALQACDLAMQYAPFHISPNELSAALRLLAANNFIGANLTLPHKIAALPLMDELHRETRELGAVNTVLFRDGRAIGFNTDGPGFVRALRSEFFVDLRDLRVLLLGVGGAGRAIALQCAREGCERLVLANRTFEKAQALVAELTPRFVGPRVLGPMARLEAVPWEENALRAQMGNIDLIVNATSLGLRAGDPPVLSAAILAPHLLVYDLIYGPRETPLLEAAREVGARGANGLSMLLQQGALAFEIWFERRAPLEVMRQALL